ncbi:CAP domain-containing protein [Rugamonas sp. CCM 8940]|uniref:CAP domain-containing protein n=1 Tax=Rugamonas sp. CCM 8940 TaxID=2765359 RepID=UPI0018F52601|nr:CAP domain-containing protein [Rugamonas sp. CCM 8940]MBJ7312169.1 CAP domain-containing protein [Rugamonas sp. CCM 8940]
MILRRRWHIAVSHGTTALSSLLLAALLGACGGGGGNVAITPATPSGASLLPQEPGAPAFTGNTALDGMNWINYRRNQLGLSVLVRNARIDTAAQGHSDYLRLNNTISHDQVVGTPGFTGAAPENRLAAAGYALVRPFAYGEVISATTEPSGFYQAEELITAIYHRFVIFEPLFREIGAGAATAAGGNAYTYFTSDLAASNGYSVGLGRGNLAVYPFDSQSRVPTNFFSDNEKPDPVDGRNEVGYPISVHANANVVVLVQNFTVRPRGGNPLPTQLLSRTTDSKVVQSVAAIIPLGVLSAATTYDVSFTGTVDGLAVTRNWSFNTK